MPLIAGLGNPGKKYRGSRHNVGFELVDKLAKLHAVNLTKGKGKFQTGTVRYETLSCRLVKPLTYMNNSGTAVQQAMQWFKMLPEECLVCYDDLNLNVGAIRIRGEGSAGGHNGMKDIIAKLGSNQFPRLRIGIGHDFRSGGQINYVLSPFTAEQRKIIDTALEKAVDAIQTYFNEGIEAAMNEFN
jgi:PTH1 family peptidyl-tRNA hydrolase